MNKFTKIVLAQIFVVVILFWFLFLAIILIFNDSEVTGQIGDSFGALNTLFSGFALIGVIAAIILQSKELRETRDEFKEQNETFRLQRFENTLFQMLSLHNENIEKIYIDISEYQPQIKEIIHSKQALDFMFDYFLRRILNVNKSEPQDGANEKLKLIEVLYKDFYNLSGSQLSHYYRSLYQILKYIRYNQLLKNDKERLFYAKIVRSQLSNSELGLLFYNCLVSEFGENFKILANDFILFDNLPESFIKYPEISKQTVGFNAFGNKP